MATQSLSSTIAAKALDNANYSPLYWAHKRINFAAIGGSAGDTYELIAIPAESAVVGGYAIVTTVLGSASSGTITFKVGSAALSGAQSCDALAKGTVIGLFPNDYEDVAGSALYVTAADTVDMVNATAIPATGKIDLYIAYIKITDNT